MTHDDMARSVREAGTEQEARTLWDSWHAANCQPDADTYARLGMAAPAGDRATAEPMSALSIARAFERLNQSMQEEGYAWSWQCNLAMTIVDRGLLKHEDANRAAAAQMLHLFNFDVTKLPEWQHLEREWARAGLVGHELIEHDRQTGEAIRKAEAVEATSRWVEPGGVIPKGWAIVDVEKAFSIRQGLRLPRVRIVNPDAEPPAGFELPPAKAALAGFDRMAPL